MRTQKFAGHFFPNILNLEAVLGTALKIVRNRPFADLKAGRSIARPALGG
jgi:hypothetical protein